VLVCIDQHSNFFWRNKFQLSEACVLVCPQQKRQVVLFVLRMFYVVTLAVGYTLLPVESTSLETHPRRPRDHK